MNVLFPLDGSDASFRALRKGLELLGRHPGFRGVAFHVREGGFEGAPEDAVRGAAPGADADASRRVLARAEEVAKDVGVPVETKTVGGRPLEAILAEARDYDVVAIHALSKSRLLDVFKGSGSGKLVRHAPTSVLVVRD